MHWTVAAMNYHYAPIERRDQPRERHRYNAYVRGDEWCPECDGETVWNDSNHDLAHCIECGACSDPDHSVSNE